MLFFRIALPYITSGTEDKKILNFGLGGADQGTLAFTATMVQCLVDWAYGRNIPMDEKLLDILRGANYLLMNDLETALIQYLLKTNDITKKSVQLFVWSQ